MHLRADTSSPVNLRFAWVIAAAAAFTAFPLGPYGALGALGACGPLFADALPFWDRRRVVAAVGAAMLLIALCADGLGWVDYLAPPVALLVGAWLSRALRAEQRGRKHSAELDFEGAMARELARARRYERPLTLLSIATSRRSDLRRLQPAVVGQLHAYCQTFVLGDRLLAIVPELATRQVPSLRARMLGAVAQQFGPVALGSATFPDAGVTAAALLERAEASRTVDGGAQHTSAGRASNGDGAGLKREFS